MTKKIIIIILFMININLVFSAEKSKLDMVTEEAMIDFNSNEFSAEGGIQFKYNDINLKAYKLKKFENMNVIQAEDNVIFQKGENKVEAVKLILNMDYEEAKLNDAVSYVLVADAPARHNRLYYGGEEFSADYPDKANIKNGWFSTSHRALKINNTEQNKPEDILPYHMKAKKVSVYPGDKVVSYNTTLYLGRVPVLWLPWYATSLKAETQAPLFPKFGSDSKYGEYIIWGFDYGRNKNYINGSVALKQSSKRGTFIEQWDNVYKIKGNKDNTGKLSLSETLFAPKGVYEEQWKFQHTHEYKGDKGKVNWNYQNQTINTINAVEDDQEEAEDEGTTDPYKNYEQKLARYELEADLSKLGKEKDLAVYGKFQYVDNQEVLKEIIGNTTEETLDDYEDAEIDNDMETNLKLTKDNRNYKVMLHYEDFLDLDPGSVSADSKSFKKQNEYQLDLKKYGFDMYYNFEKTDQWRGLSSAERESSGVELRDLTGSKYNPYTVGYYDIKETEERKLVLGEYEVKKDYKLTLEYDIETYEEKLNRDQDPFRLSQTYQREREYNRSVNIIQKETEDEYYNVKLKNKTRNAKLELGTYSESYKDRTNYADTGYDTYKNNSNYKIFEIQDTKINMSKAGFLNAKYSLRQDIFEEKDELTAHDIELTLSKELYDNTWNYLRAADVKLNNDIGYQTLFYNYYSDERNFPDDDDKYILNGEDSKKYRLSSKKEEKFYNDTITLNVGNTITAYNIDLKHYYDAYDTSWKTDDDFSNSIEFKVDNQRTIYTIYSTNKDFQEDGYNNNKVETLQLVLADPNKEFTYSNSISNSKVRKSYVDSTENYSDRLVSYSFLRYESEGRSDSISYGFGEKKERWMTLGYGLATNETYDYYDTSGNSVNSYSVKNLKKSYSLKYVLGEESVKAHLVKLDYIDYSDEYDEQYSYYKYGLEYSYVDDTKPEKEVEKEVVYEDQEGEYQIILTQAEEDELTRKLAELNKKNLGSDFNLMGLGEVEDTVIYKKYYRVYITGTVDKEYQKQFSTAEALEELKLRSEFHHERTKVTYEYTETSDIDKKSDGTYKKDIESKTHEFTLLTKFGELDYAWKLGGAIKFEDYITNPITERRLDSWNIDLGKEFEYAEWTLGYEVDWSTTYTRYDYIVSFKVNLLTFPEKVFGLKKNSKKDNLEFEAGM